MTCLFVKVTETQSSVRYRITALVHDCSGEMAHRRRGLCGLGGHGQRGNNNEKTERAHTTSQAAKF
jgi:hypothetical protein